MYHNEHIDHHDKHLQNKSFHHHNQYNIPPLCDYVLHDGCDPTTGDCIYTSLCVNNNTVACTGSICNTTTDSCEETYNNTLCPAPDFCSVGICTPTGCNGSEPLNCNDNNPCTSDYCDPLSGCVYTSLNESLCGDDFTCTLDSCIPVNATFYMCLNTPDVALCPVPEFYPIDCGYFLCIPSQFIDCGVGYNNSLCNSTACSVGVCGPADFPISQLGCTSQDTCLTDPTLISECDSCGNCTCSSSGQCTPNCIIPPVGGKRALLPEDVGLVEEVQDPVRSGAVRMTVAYGFAFFWLFGFLLL